MWRLTSIRKICFRKHILISSNNLWYILSLYLYAQNLDIR